MFNEVFPILLSFLAVVIALYSWLTNSEPVIVFIWDDKFECYFIKNIGKGPAMNITVSYINDTESIEWKNPVRCYSLEPNGIIYIDWGLKSGGMLFSKKRDVDMNPDYYLSGVTKLSAVYSSANFLFDWTYTSILEGDFVKRQNGNRIRQWKEEEINRIWDLRSKKKDEESKTEGKK